MLKIAHKGFIHYGINYSNIVEPSLNPDQILTKSEPISTLKLALIKRKQEIVNVEEWSSENKGVIISEYPAETTASLSKKGISSDCYKLVKVSGHSEGYLRDKNFDLCDAIVHTGKTL